jgi:glycine dehydrogenase
MQDIIDGKIAVEQSALRHAPHTAESLLGEWDREYSRTQAAYPTGVPELKYWPPVQRIDGAYGDRNFVCTCPEPSAYEQA